MKVCTSMNHSAISQIGIFCLEFFSSTFGLQGLYPKNSAKSVGPLIRSHSLQDFFLICRRCCQKVLILVDSAVFFKINSSLSFRTFATVPSLLDIISYRR
jgi:hypothetical protein